ncbi:MAG: NUDIX domain-containing protein [Rickettsiales bacterium]|nr:MAG: NUDIX domain-containing protein [Rickettsiales bacterium]
MQNITNPQYKSNMINYNTVYTSHLGVYALITDDNEVLLIKKNRGPYKGLLDLPGGSLEKHESIEEALFREIKEETGLDISDYKQLRTIDTFFNYNENDKPHILRHIAIIYKISVDKTKVKYDPDGEDSDGCVWLDTSGANNEILSPIACEAIKLVKYLPPRENGGPGGT